ncbi:N-acetylglucosamine kinase [Oerskovia enterophila]|uniref:BadF/BadG/BcrA/BcrD ATPase family protein n=1 Tax=Oerskovia enterophila TaxID=43678 RepID=A0ABX2XZP6_9CELL|nr:BadF/BadG/BcrA/BcrD ATPase family protein [Oerskovia enterophila]OCI29778.1 BadF/BadG/BcrA/BcrD ATPase family protein [Oerskovia enterophila]
MTWTPDVDPARTESRAHPLAAPSGPPRWLVAIDVGGSGSRLVATTVPSGARPDAAHPPVAPGDAPHRTELTGRSVAIGPDGSDVADVVRDLCASFVAATTGSHDAPPVVAAAAVGATGLATLVPDPATVHTALRTTLAADRTAVAADALTAHLGALGGRAGAVVAVGTGAIALGTDLRRVWRRTDGWGHLLGDLGSASWIGAHGLRAALAAHDGRATGGSRPLLAAAQARFGPVPTWPVQLYTRPDRAQVLGSFTPDVAAAAAAGDPASVQILTEAGRHLAETLAAALVPGLPPLAAATGGVLAAGPSLTGALARRFAALRPDAELVPSAGTPLDGALHLARLLTEGTATGGAAASTAPAAPLVAHAPWLSLGDEPPAPAPSTTTPITGDPT